MEGYISSLRRLIGHRKFIHPAARILLENAQRELLLILRSDNNSCRLGAGALEEGETIEACIRREVTEETGLVLRSLVPIGMSTRPSAETVTYPNGDVVQYFTVVFYSNDWERQPVERSEEAREIRFFSPESLPLLSANEQPSIE